MAHIQEFFTSRNNGTDGSNYIGNIGRLWYEPDTNVIKVSDGVTPGGIQVGGGGGGGYILPTASTTVKGGVKIDGTTITINNQVISVQNGVFTTGSYVNPSWITSLAYSKLSGAPTNVSFFSNDAGYLTSYTETDPVFSASPAATITNTNISNWNTAYGWGNHATAGYLTASSLGSITFTGTTIDSNDSSAITFTPRVNFDSDVAIGNDLILNGTTITASGTQLTINGQSISSLIDYDQISGAPTLTGGSVNQILVKKSSTDYDFQWEELIVDPTYTKLLDDTVANTLYLGEAVPNSLESSSVWRIQKIVFDASGNVDSVRFASGGLFNQIWNDRLSLNYV